MKQYVIEGISDYMDSLGYLKTQLIGSDNTTKIIHRSDKVGNDIKKGTVLTFYGQSIAHSSSGHNKKGVLTCPICGNVFQCPASGPVTCSDPDCISKVSPWFQHFAQVLSLPLIDQEALFASIETKEIITFSDILILPKYKDIKISTGLFTFLSAFVPPEICSQASLLSQIAIICGNSADSFIYFVQHIDRLAIELGLSSPGVERLLDWLSDPYISCTLLTLLDSDQFTISADSKVFDGAPIFRGKTIAITGTFKRGSLDDIMNILRSYSADVSVGIQDNADCLVIGGLNEGNDGRSIQIAASSNLLTFTEDQFFTQFDIDSDLSAHLSTK